MDKSSIAYVFTVIFSDTDTFNSYGVECLQRLMGVQVTQIYTDFSRDKILTKARIFLTEASKKLKTKRFVESLLEALKRAEG